MSGLEQALTVYGPLGIFVVALGWAYLKERAARDADRTTLETRINDLQEKRLTEALDGRAQMAEVVSTLRQAIEVVQGAGR